jgi:hypothetical protein
MPNIEMRGENSQEYSEEMALTDELIQVDTLLKLSNC